LVDEHFITRGKADYCSVDATAHYKIYYLSPHKVHLFDIQDEAVREQMNYVFDEDEIIRKGPIAH